MTIEQLAHLCAEAAADLIARHPRPLPATVIIPLAESTQVISLPDFPSDDPSRFDLLRNLADEKMVPVNAPCFGFIAEATVAVEGDTLEVLAVAFGARRLGTHIMAAPFVTGDGNETLGEFSDPEDLDPSAMPFLAPLHHAADAAAATQDPTPPGLPIFPS